MGTLLPSVSSLVEELEELSPDQLGKLAAFLAQLRHSHETPTSSVADNGLSELLDSGLIDGFWQQHGDNPTARWASPGLQQRLGYRPGEIRDHSEWLIDHLDASDAAAIQIDICRLLNDPSFKSERLLRYRHQDGSPVWMRCRLLRLADKVLVAHTDVTTFKRAGERLRALYEAVPDMHVVMEISGFRILNCNQRFGEVAGFSREEIVGRPFLDLLQPEGLIQFQAATATLSQQGKCANYELLLERKDGSCLAALVSSSLGHDCETNAPYIQCWFRDIAHLKRLANYEFLLEALPQAVLLIDFEGRIRASNPVAAKTFGYSQPELLELNVLTLLPKRYRSGDGDLLRSLLERSTRRDFGASADLIGVRKSGHEFPAQTGLGRLQTFDGPLILVTIIDRTEQKRLEQDLLEHKERVRLALDSGAIGIWDFEVTTGRSVADARCKAAYGIPSDGTWSSDIGLKAVHPDDRGRLLQAIRAAYGPASDGSFHAEYRTIGVFDGVLRQVQADGKVFFVRQGSVRRRPVRFVGTLQDITERKDSEEALRRANQDLEQFAYAAAHDLQEPLRNVATTMGLLKRNKHRELDESSLALIDESIASAKRMHTMVRDLLTFTRVTDLRGKVPGHVDTNQMLQQVLSDLRNVIEETGARIVFDALPPVCMHATHVSQLFTNLLGNALKYKKPGVRPRISVAAVRKTPVWQFMITDNGIGFDRIHAEQIFGVFKRLHHQHEYSGTGIGLAICSRIVSLYGGRIWAEGQPGEGATFFFTVPLKGPENHGRHSPL